MRTAVVGHVEWAEIFKVERVPSAGEIVHASPWWEGPAGGGADTAVQLLRLAGECTLFTSLGDDELGERARSELGKLGLDVQASLVPEPTRRALTLVDGTGERTITVIGSRLAPSGSDALDWGQLDGAAAVYVTAGDTSAIKRARSAEVVVATARILDDLRHAGVALDALVGSRRDPAEAFDDPELEPPPRLLVLTDGAEGGIYRRDDERWSGFESSAPEGPIVDRYGAGDAFAGGLTFGLGSGMDDREALGLASRCGAAALTHRGPYEPGG